MTKTSQESQDNRERIMLAAEGLFASQGFSATSVREIVGQANVTAPVLYYYFGSKDELLRTLIAERFDAHLTRIRDAIVGVKTLEDLISQWYRSGLAVTTEHPTALRLVLGALWGPDMRHLDGLVYGFFDTSKKLFCASIQELEPTISQERAEYGYLLLSGMLNAFLFPLLRMGMSFDVDEIVRSLTPRVAAILRDDAPLPTGTLHQLNDHVSTILSEHAESATQETP